MCSMALLDQHRALKFLEKIGIIEGKALLAQDPVLFLNTIIRSFTTHLPFQCVSLMAQAEEERHVPSLEEIIEAGLSLEGGLCFDLNVFMYILLSAFELKVHFLDGSYSASKDLHTHVVVLVKDLRCPGDDHFIDVGCGHPFLEAVAVNSLPVTFYQAGLKYTYCRKGDLVLRLHHDHNLGNDPAVMVGELRQFFHFSLNPVDLKFFYSNMDKVYISEEKSVFLQGIRAVRFPQADSLPTKELSTLGGATSIANENSGICEHESNLQREENSLNTKDSETLSENSLEILGDIAKNACKPESSEGEAEDRDSAEHERIMVAMKDQSLLLGRIDAAIKTKVSVDEWTATLKHYFPTIPPAKVDLAVHRMVQKLNLQ
ncbi:hypothetical protein OTU49_016675 [Cherax quadricarinatus]|uniref:arylamine N-acetyltransferase n=1 Tax=Cherax quadricarinatus TaxID=27406 RepID=A0AAW0Y5D5_CHEQU